ncbi:transposase [Paraburkholderia sp. BL27I4N3]|uniref:IS66 family transposase n=1 Tax=Paraburkholderia sp. BL27I4N3 TaxID=1938805 RepID=UPI000E23B08B
MRARAFANILVNTYVDHLPLIRREMRYARRGIHLPRATLCEWKPAAAVLLGVLMPPLRAHQLQAPRMHVDDTRHYLCLRRAADHPHCAIMGLSGCRRTRGEWRLARSPSGGRVRVR